MSVEVDICTSAMIKIGAEPINSLLDDTKEARLCRLQYPKIRDSILRSAPWSFALKRLSVSKLDGDLIFGEGNQFQLPIDCVRFVKMYVGDGYVSNEKYVIEGDVLIANVESLQGWYVCNTVEVEKYDSNFKEAVACALAADLCYSLTQSNTLKQSLMDSCKFYIEEARSYNSQEVSPENFVFDEFLNVRRSTHEIY